MYYDLMLYAANRTAIGSEIHSGRVLLERVLQRIISDGGYSANDLQIFESILSAGISGQWPDDGTTDPFESLCWLLQVAAEPVSFAEFPGFKHRQILEDSRLLLYFNAAESPIALPKGSGTHALATVLTNAKMKDVLERESQHADPLDQGARHLRTLLLDLVESLEPDDLDLYLIVK